MDGYGYKGGMAPLAQLASAFGTGCVSDKAKRVCGALPAAPAAFSKTGKH